MPRLYSYVLREDTGFAPNPYHGFCTLACCKPRIRERAEIGDWVIGTGSSAKGKDRGGFIAFAMKVTEVLAFEQYWDDERFQAKKPNLYGTLEDACGDNLYLKNSATERWCQIPGLHCEFSLLETDTKVNRVLVSDDFIYWGSCGPTLPEFRGQTLSKKGPGYRVNFPADVVADFVSWIRGLQAAGDNGICGKPLDLELAAKEVRKARKKPSLCP